MKSRIFGVTKPKIEYFVVCYCKNHNIWYNGSCERNTRKEGNSTMKIIKRNGAEVVFDIEKIRSAISRANAAVEEDVRMTELQITRISEAVKIACEEMGHSPSVEEIQDLVEKAIMAHGAFFVNENFRQFWRDSVQPWASFVDCCCFL